jgi:hypothetical protein
MARVRTPPDGRAVRTRRSTPVRTEREEEEEEEEEMNLSDLGELAESVPPDRRGRFGARSLRRRPGW